MILCKKSGKSTKKIRHTTDFFLKKSNLIIINHYYYRRFGKVLK